MTWFALQYRKDGTTYPVFHEERPIREHLGRAAPGSVREIPPELAGASLSEVARWVAVGAPALAQAHEAPSDALAGAIIGFGDKRYYIGHLSPGEFAALRGLVGMGLVSYRNSGQGDVRVEPGSPHDHLQTRSEEMLDNHATNADIDALIDRLDTIAGGKAHEAQEDRQA